MGEDLVIESTVVGANADTDMLSMVAIYRNSRYDLNSIEVELDDDPPFILFSFLPKNGHPKGVEGLILTTDASGAYRFTGISKLDTQGNPTKSCNIGSLELRIDANSRSYIDSLREEHLGHILENDSYLRKDQIRMRANYMKRRIASGENVFSDN